MTLIIFASQANLNAPQVELDAVVAGVVLPEDMVLLIELVVVGCIELDGIGDMPVVGTVDRSIVEPEDMVVELLLVELVVFWPDTRHDGRSSPTRRMRRGTPVAGEVGLWVQKHRQTNT